MFMEELTMDFPLDDLMDEQACYDTLARVLHPQGLTCPRCQCPRMTIHRAHRAPVLDYRCKACGRVFNAFTGTILHRTQKRPSRIMLILRGIAQGVPTAQLARELGLSRWHLLEWRHRLQDHAARGRERKPLEDAVTEADEMYQNSGEKREKARKSRRSA
jgi:transposase-like protein